MYSNIVLNILKKPANTGRISKPDGIADMYNADQTSHVEFSLRIESGIITDCKFRAQANPYIIAICSTITTMVKGKMLTTVFLDPFNVKETLGDHTETDIMFCIECLRLAIQDYREKLEKTNKTSKKEEIALKTTELEDVAEASTVSKEDVGEDNANELPAETENDDFLDFDDDELTDEDFGFFDFDDEE